MYSNIELRESSEIGLGVFSTCNIKDGTRICEYQGKFLKYKEDLELENIYSRDNTIGNYMFFFRDPKSDKKCCIDATYANGQIPKGQLSLKQAQQYLYLTGIGRYINHSKKNSNIVPKVESSDTSTTPKLVFYSNKNIPSNTELFFDYGDDRPNVVVDFPWLKK